MAEGRLGRAGVLVAILSLFLGACTSTDSAPETTVDETSTTRDTSQRSTTTTTVGRSSTSAPTTTTTPATTTTTSPTDSTEAPPETSPEAGDGVIGVVGCSNSGDAVEGYHDVSALGLLTPGNLGGGAISLWGDPSNSGYSTYWGLYDNRRPAEGYAGTWVQLCIRTSEHQGAFDADEQQWVTHIVEQISARDPGVPIWISPLNFYANGVVCEAVGADGPAIAAEASDWASAVLPGVFRGPDLGPLTQADLGVRDNCHPGKDGKLLLGSQLAAFFD